MKQSRAVVLALTLGLSSSCSCEPDPPVEAWEPILVDLDGAILSFWGDTVEDLYAVGGTLEAGGGQALVLWHDGSAWWSMPAPAPTLWWVHGFAHDDVWAVGDLGTILHFDGVAWTVVDGGGFDYTLWGVWGASPNELWAVGGSAAGGQPGVLRRWSGGTWSDVTGLDLTDLRLFKVWGTAADDVFVVGDEGTALHWDGVAWTWMVSGTTQRLLTVRGRAPDDVWAVGGITQAVLLHWDGVTWSSVDTGLQAGLMGLWTAAGSPVVVAGFAGTAAVGDGAVWTVTDSGTSECLHGAWGDGNGNVAAGGGDLFYAGGARGVIVGRGALASGPVGAWTGN